MNKEKQIEEMAKTVCHLDRTCDECMASFECKAMMYAKRFYNAGYRKASEVVDEFVVKLMEMPISCYIPLLGLSTKDEIEEHFNDIMLQVKDAINTVAEELKKKYAEDGE